MRKPVRPSPPPPGNPVVRRRSPRRKAALAASTVAATLGVLACGSGGSDTGTVRSTSSSSSGEVQVPQAGPQPPQAFDPEDTGAPEPDAGTDAGDASDASEGG